jgi:hypothetical protein
MSQELSTIAFGSGALTAKRSTEILYPVPGLYEKTSQAFRTELVQIANELGVDANLIAGIISIETAGTFSPKITNPITNSHVGLLQFSELTARNLGTSHEALKRMSAKEQLSYVWAYFVSVVGGHRTSELNTPTRIYMAVFYPKMIFASPNEPISIRGEAVYDQNQGLDADHDGILTPSDVGNVLSNVVERAKRREIPKSASHPAFPIALVGTAIVGIATVAIAKSSR